MIDETMITMIAYQMFNFISTTIFILIAIIQCGTKKAGNAATGGAQPAAAPAILPPMDEQKTQSVMDEGEGEGEKKKESAKEVEEKKESKKEGSKKNGSKKENSKKEDSKKDRSKKETGNTAMTQQSDQKIPNEMKVMATQEVQVNEEKEEGEANGEKKEEEKKEEKKEEEKKEEKKEGETDKKEDKKDSETVRCIQGTHPVHPCPVHPCTGTLARLHFRLQQYFDNQTVLIKPN